MYILDGARVCEFGGGAAGCWCAGGGGECGGEYSFGIISMGSSGWMMSGRVKGAGIGCTLGELVSKLRVFQIFNPDAQTRDSNQQQC